MSATNYLSRKLVDLFNSVAAYSPPPLYVSLHSIDPGGSGSHANEVSGGNYFRQSLVGKMSAADGSGISSNTVAINFGPASSDWGTVASVAIEDALTGGNMLMTSSPTAPKAVTSGQPFQIAPGNLRIRL
jgi:hypothetical protein